jgi:glycerol-3-phosphate responsive antiterminator
MTSRRQLMMGVAAAPLSVSFTKRAVRPRGILILRSNDFSPEEELRFKELFRVFATVNDSWRAPEFT